MKQNVLKIKITFCFICVVSTALLITSLTKSIGRWFKSSLRNQMWKPPNVA